MIVANEITPEVIASVAGRFWTKVDMRGPDECWEWNGSRSIKGYGKIRVFNRHWVASRIAAALGGNTPAPELMVCHRCDNPPCCNPNHLFLGTNYENIQDRAAKGRGADRRGEENGRAKLTAEQVREVRASTVSARGLARQMGVKPTTIRDIRSGRSWGHVQ